MAEKKFYVGIKAVIRDDERGVLLLKSEKGFWDFPGGRVDDNETFEQTLKRELSEEIEGCKLLSLKNLLAADRLHIDLDKDISLVLLFYLVFVELPQSIKTIDDHNDFLWVKKRSDIPRRDIKDSMVDVLASILE